MKQLIAACLLVSGILSAQVPSNLKETVTGTTPVYRITVTERTAKAISYQHRSGATKFNAGVNMGAMEAYRLMIGVGFRSFLQGVAMHRPWIEIYDRPDVFALEDWR